MPGKISYPMTSWVGDSWCKKGQKMNLSIEAFALVVCLAFIIGLILGVNLGRPKYL